MRQTGTALRQCRRRYTWRRRIGLLSVLSSNRFGIRFPVVTPLRSTSVRVPVFVPRSESGLAQNQIIFLLLDLVLIMVAAHTLGRVAERLGQPAVLGEITAGILAGPTILGAQLSGFLFPSDVRTYLVAFANFGVLLFMFLAGLEIDRDSIGKERGSVAAVAVGAYVTPFAVGCAIVPWSLSRHVGDNRMGFTLFIGAALAVTAFPVLARILHDRELLGSRVGRLAMASAAVDDLLAWAALAVVIGIARPDIGTRWSVLLVIPLFALLWWVVRPALVALTSSIRVSGGNLVIVVAVCGALLAGAATEWLGLHLIFGAFAFGLIFPRDQRGAVVGEVKVLSRVFLPAFFVVVGLHVDLGTLDRAGVGELVVIVAAALLGKIGGTYVAARCVGITPREAGALASLMNTRGLTELVILDIGLTIGLVGDRLYSLMVLMALVTTGMTGPLLKLCGADPRRRASGPTGGPGSCVVGSPEKLGPSSRAMRQTARIRLRE
ncbi:MULTISPECIES: cation:proton antiporter [Nocardia]|uniref:cation:proton antiporter n=1 Tax=Nocardia TaxID=1817 RepID=UPI001E583E3D|nr:MULTISPECIES: cation:proton antiporter [Nocardia]